MLYIYIYVYRYVYALTYQSAAFEMWEGRRSIDLERSSWYLLDLAPQHRNILLISIMHDFVYISPGDYGSI